MSTKGKVTTLEYSQIPPPAHRRIATAFDLLAMILACGGLWFSFPFMELLHATLIPQLVVRWAVCAGLAVLILGFRKTVLRNWGRIHAAILTITLVFVGLGAVSLYDALTAIDPHIPARNMMYCQSHLQSLYGAMQLYAAEHGGLCPDSLMVLAQKELNDGDEINEFVSPAGQPQGYYGPTPTTQQILTEIQGKSPTYIYLAKGMTFPPSASTVMIYDAAFDHMTLERGGDGVHILYGDGTVKWLEGRAKRAFLKQMESRSKSATKN